MTNPPTYEELWAEHQRLVGNVDVLNTRLKDATDNRDAVGRHLEEVKDSAPAERVQELREDYGRLDGRVEGLRKEYVEAQTAVGALELKAASVDPQMAQWLSDGAAPAPSAREQMKEGFERVDTTLGVVDAAKAAAEWVVKTATAAGFVLASHGAAPVQDGAVNPAHAPPATSAPADVTAPNASLPPESLQTQIQEVATTLAQHPAQAQPPEVARAARPAHEAEAAPEEEHRKEDEEQREALEHAHDIDEERKQAQAEAEIKGMETYDEAMRNGRTRDAPADPPREVPQDPARAPAEDPPAHSVHDPEPDPARAPAAPQPDAAATAWQDPGPGSVTAAEAPAGGVMAGYEQLAQSFEESSLHQMQTLPEQPAAREAAAPQDPGFPQDRPFQDKEAGGLGKGPDSFATCEPPQIPEPLYETHSDLNPEPPPPPPPPPPAEDPTKGRSH